MTRTRVGPTAWILGSLVLLLALPQAALAGWCWNYSEHDANHPLPWVTGCDSADGDFAAGSTTGQKIRHEHRNWHCSNCIPGKIGCSTPNTTFNQEAYGRAFLAFHRQLILDFDNWRLATPTGLGPLDIWSPYDDALVPGDDESTSDAFTHCSPCLPGTCSPGSPYRRAAGAVCSGCSDLPSDFTTDLGDFDNLGELGYQLELDWHGSYHNGVKNISPGCGDIAGFHYTTRDPAFWMAHKKLDEIARDWQILQAADVVLVIDRSGSMGDNCTSTTPPHDESPCAINDAREAARAFADLVEDGEGHKVAIVSFSGTATDDLGLTAATGIVSDNGVDDTPFEVAATSIASWGPTSIGAGVEKALSILSGGSNSHQAMLVLTDGKENTEPCLVSDASDCSGTEVAQSAYGDAQVVAIGFGDGAEETALRTVAERHGGIFIAQQNLVDAADDLDPNKLLKFYVNAFSEIFDSAPSVDPDGVMPRAQYASALFPIEICGEREFSVFLGRAAPEGTTGDWSECDLQLEVFSPTGSRVNRSDSGVEAGHGPRYDFVRVDLPHHTESTGQWMGQVVRPGTGICEDQRYFYTIMTPGMGRVKAFPLKPKLTVGQELTASFRLTESFNPHKYWDDVSGQVVVTGPRGESATYPLYDDGSNGDTTAGNNTWTVQVPGAVSVAGAYHLRAIFDLTRNGCTTTREAAYAIIAEPPAQVCSGLIAAQSFEAVAGGATTQLDELACVWNDCAEVTTYEVVVSDSLGWLLMEDNNGNLVAASGSQSTGTLLPGEHLCFGGAGGNPNDLPFHLAIPTGASVGDQSTVQIIVRSGGSSLDLVSTTTLQVIPVPDCNANGVHDAVDIANGTSLDANQNGIPDDCPDDVSFGHGGDGTTDIPALSAPWLVLVTGLFLVGGFVGARVLRRRRSRVL